MNCYVVIIKEENGVLDAEVDEEIDEDNKNYEGTGCQVNLPNNASEYFTTNIYEYVNGTREDLTYNKYNQWWTLNSVELEIKEKDAENYPIEKVEFLE